MAEELQLYQIYFGGDDHSYQGTHIYSKNNYELEVTKLEDAYKFTVVNTPNHEDIGVSMYTDYPFGVDKKEYLSTSVYLSKDGKQMILAGGFPLRIYVLEFDNIYKTLLEVAKLFNK